MICTYTTVRGVGIENESAPSDLCFYVPPSLFQALLELDTLSLLEETLNNVDTNRFMWHLCQNYPECFDTPEVTCDIQEASKLILERFGSDAAPKIALKVLLELGTIKHLSTEAFPTNVVKTHHFI